MARRTLLGFIEHVSHEPPPARHHLLLIDRLQAVIDGRLRRLMVFWPPGGAKALALDTPIPTPQGWKRMGDLSAGDEVFDENGRPCRVTWRSPVWRNRPVYRVVTDCGDQIVADRDHEWAVCLDRKQRQPLKCNGLGAPPKPNRGDPKSRASIKETWELAHRRAKRPMIFRASALDLPEADLPIDPYLLGVWLGDGTSTTVAITSSLSDQPWLRAELHRLGYKTSNRSKPTLFGVLGVRALFVKLRLLNDPWHNTVGEKHIPDVYLRASTSQRLALLQGLIDSDGTVRDDGQVTYCTTSKRLAEQARELVRSLGVKAGMTNGRAKLNGRDCGPLFRVRFYHAQAARLPRKAALCRNQRRTPNTYITVEPAGYADTVCIEVDSPNHLFLCGRSMTPTHNSTYASVLFPACVLAHRKRIDIVAASHTGDLADHFGRQVRNIVGSQRYATTFGHTLDPSKKAAGDWATTAGGRYFAAGVGGALPGRRGDIGLIDDPIKGREDADSETIRSKTWEWYRSDFRTRLKPNGAIVIIETRWHEDDLAGMILPEDYDHRSGLVTARDGEVWDVVNVPALIESEEDMRRDVLGRTMGESYWPEWFTAEALEQERVSQGPRNWASLYQQRPSPEEGAFFMRDWLRWYDKAPPVETLRIYGAADYAATEDGGDYTVFAIVGVDPVDNVYLLDLWRAQAATDVWTEMFLSMVGHWRPLEWAEEKGPITRSVGPFMHKRMTEAGVYVYRKQWPCPADKPSRAQAIRGRMAQGKVYFPRTAPWLDDLLHEILVFPNGRTDDQVDTLSLVGRMLARMTAGKAPKPEPPPITTIHDTTLDRLWQDKDRADSYP